METTPLALIPQDRRRFVAKEADVLLRNRFLEGNPVLNGQAPAFIARPGLKFFREIGNGPIRALYQQPGAFDDDMFVVSYDTLYRLQRDGTAFPIFSGLAGADSNGRVRLCATGDVGDIEPHLFFCDGTGLFCYTEGGFAISTFTATAFANNDTVRIGDTYYKYTTGSVDSGTPLGTSGAPWLLRMTAFIQPNYDALYHAVNASGTPGTEYSTALTVPNDLAMATVSTSTGVVVAGKESSTGGAGVVTTETGANMAWSSALTEAGTGDTIIQVATPDDVGVIDIAYINNFVIVIPAQGEGKNGRFYWIQPGETTIDALDYATAERSPDPIYQVVVFNDQFWLPGQNTTEVWFMTGDPDTPTQRLQGVVFDRGTYPGTAIQVKDSMVIADAQGGVFQIKGGETRISTPDVEERIRKAQAYQDLNSIA